MHDFNISNSIYLSMASLECIIICILKANASVAYYHGILWLFPLLLAAIPAYREIKKEFSKKD